MISLRWSVIQGRSVRESEASLLPVSRRILITLKSIRLIYPGNLFGLLLSLESGGSLELSRGNREEYAAQRARQLRLAAGRSVRRAGRGLDK